MSAVTREERPRERVRHRARPRSDAHYASSRIVDSPYETADEAYDTSDETAEPAPVPARVSRPPRPSHGRPAVKEREGDSSSRPRPTEASRHVPERRRRHRRHRGARSYSQHGSSHAPDPSHRVRAPEEVYGSPTSRTPGAASGTTSVPPRRDAPERRERRAPRRVSRPPAGVVASSARTARLLAGEPTAVADVRSIRTGRDSTPGDAVAHADAFQVAQEKPRTNKDRELARVPRNEVNQMKEGRVFAMNGIDNVALLMVRCMTNSRRTARTKWRAFPCTCSSRR